MTTSPPTVYNGRANRIDIALTQGDVTIDAGSIQGAALRVFDKKHGTLVRYIEGRASESPNEADIFDYTASAVVPGAGSAPIGIISMQLGLADPRIPPDNAYWCDLIIFSVADPEGISWAQFYLAVIPEAPTS